jgi:hypothetical protein
LQKQKIEEENQSNYCRIGFTKEENKLRADKE